MQKRRAPPKEILILLKVKKLFSREFSRLTSEQIPTYKLFEYCYELLEGLA